MDFGALTVAFDEGGVFPVHRDLLDAAEFFQSQVLQLDAEVFADEFAAGEDSNVFAQGLAAITKARGFDGAHIDRTPEFVHHQSGEGFAFDIFGDDQERFGCFGHLFEQRKQVFEAADLLLVVEYIAILEADLHRFGIGDEVGRQITLVELHAFDHVERGLDGLRFLNRDGPVFSYLVHRVGDDLANAAVPVGGNGGDLFDFRFVLHLLGDLVELLDGGGDRLIDAALDADGVGAGGDVLQPLAEDRLRQDSGGGGAVAGVVAGLAGDFADHLGAHIFIRVFQFDFLGDRDPVFGHRRRAIFLVEHDVAAFGSERRRDGPGQFGDAFEQRLTSILVEEQLFCSHKLVDS